MLNRQPMPMMTQDGLESIGDLSVPSSLGSIRPMTKNSYRPDPDRDPVGPFLHYLMAECGVSPHTLAAYRSDLMRFLRWRKASCSRAAGPGGHGAN